MLMKESSQFKHSPPTQWNVAIFQTQVGLGITQAQFDAYPIVDLF